MSVSTIYSQSQLLLNADCSGVPSTQISQKMDTDTEIVEQILQLEKEQLLTGGKPAKSQQCGLPENPILYDSSQAKIWISHFLNDYDILNAGEIICRLDRLEHGINGATLARWNEADYKRIFGNVCGDIMHRSFKSWIDHFKKNQSVPVHPQAIQTSPIPSITPYEQQALQQRNLTFNENLYSIFEPVEEKVNLQNPVIPSPTLSGNYCSPIPTDYPSPISSVYDDPISNHWNSPLHMGYNQPTEFNFEPTPWFKHERITSDGDSEAMSDSSVAIDESEPDFNNNQVECKLPPFPDFLNRNQNRHNILPVQAVPPMKRKRGRPRKPKPEKPKRTQPILYKFILMHLESPSTSRKYMEWVNRSEGIFRFHSAQKDNFAREWGKYKRNREPMTYQNMARALRNYTKGKRKVMERVKRKLHYKFCSGFVPA